MTASLIPLRSWRRGASRELSLRIREDSNVMAASDLTLRGENDLVLTAAPFGGGVNVEDSHENRGPDFSRAFSFANF